MKENKIMPFVHQFMVLFLIFKLKVEGSYEYFFKSTIKTEFWHVHVFIVPVISKTICLTRYGNSFFPHFLYVSKKNVV